jgi:hypothetical protein
LSEVVENSKMHDIGGGVLWEREFHQTGTRYIRFYFDQISSPPGVNYHIRVVDGAENEVRHYETEQFARSESFMTDLLPPGDLRVQLVADSLPQGLVFRLASVSWQQWRNDVRSETPVLDFLPLAALPDGSPLKKVAPSVAMLHIGPDLLEITCTGVLVERNVIATNYHCVENSLDFKKTEGASSPTCNDVIAEFDYLQNGRRGPTARCKTVKASKQLDVALLTFDPNDLRMADGQQRPSVLIRPRSEGMPAKVHLIQHPLGLPLAVAENCRVPRMEQIDILHNCNSASGSSGSPLLDEQLRWVGLHYQGAYRSDWSQQMVENDFIRNGPRYNRARISTAVADFAAQ